MNGTAAYTLEYVTKPIFSGKVEIHSTEQPRNKSNPHWSDLNDGDTKYETF